MSAQTEASGSALDTAMLWTAVAVLVASIVGYYYFEAQFNVLVRTLGMIAGGVVAVVIALQSTPGRMAWHVVRESRVEFRKVVWPTRPETIQTTAIIMFVVLILGLMLWGVDSMLLLGLQWLTGRGG